MMIVLVSFFALLVSTASANNITMMSTAQELSATSFSEGSERLAHWSRRWTEKSTTWHNEQVHESLIQYGSKVIPNFEKDEGETCSHPVRVFVPLCGKTVDMAFLARHPSVSEVVGIDGIRQALEEFSSENPDLEIVASSSAEGAYERLKGQKITLLKGDFFGLDDTATNGKFDVIWDRASLVAIQPELREAYADVMGNLIKPGGTLLVSTVDRRSGTPEEMAMGPPFSVPESEVRRLYERLPWVESVDVLGEFDQFEKYPSQRAFYEPRGLSSFFQVDLEIKTHQS